MQLSGLYLYPIKSSAPLEMRTAVVEPRGLRHDRRWMVVDAEGRFLTGRQLPRLTLVRAQPDSQGLSLNAPGMPSLQVPFPQTEATVPVNVWKNEVAAKRVDAAADAWLSEFLQQPVHLVHMDASVTRPMTDPHSRPGDEVSFADAFPLLLISRAALDGLNARLAKPVSMLQFRPNLVVDGVAAHAEDGWKRIRIGEVEFDVAKACTRCVFTTVDPARGERDPDGEPLRTLIGYRRTAEGVTFGQNLIPRSLGSVRVGDAVEVLA
ncbi:MAG TPA: MOSC domain-containing protein [Pseudoxanthomonas sp.]|nr:MOSC domain-containing protein [Pseudoxanthomonas sp.]